MMFGWARHPVPGLGDAPVGALMAFAGKVCPSASSDAGWSAADTYADGRVRVEAWGWMACDGRTLQVSLYPELFLAIGYLYGGKDDTFKLPDYRGYFWRGINGDGAADPDVDQRVPPPGANPSDSSAKNEAGSTQAFALQFHEHAYGYAQDATAAPAQDAAGTESLKTKLTGGPVKGDGKKVDVNTSDNETRPINIYVNYIIKFTSGFAPEPPFPRPPFN